LTYKLDTLGGHRDLDDRLLLLLLLLLATQHPHLESVLARSDKRLVLYHHRQQQ